MNSDYEKIPPFHQEYYYKTISSIEKRNLSKLIYIYLHIYQEIFKLIE